MKPWKERLRTDLEPVLAGSETRERINDYHDLPFGIFIYPPEEEFALREEVTLLATRLGQRGKRVTRISLAECLHSALAAEAPIEKLADAEKRRGLAKAVETVASVLSDYRPLADLVVERLPANPEPARDIIFLTRAGALFPAYRTSALLEQLMGRVDVPVVLFYPGDLDGPAGLRFMSVLEAEHNYRSRIY